MKIIKKIGIIFIIMFSLVTTINTSSFAQLETYLYKNSGRQHWYILRSNKTYKSEAGVHDDLNEVFINTLYEKIEKLKVFLNPLGVSIPAWLVECYNLHGSQKGDIEIKRRY